MQIMSAVLYGILLILMAAVSATGIAFVFVEGLTRLFPNFIPSIILVLRLPRYESHARRGLRREILRVTAPYFDERRAYSRDFTPRPFTPAEVHHAARVSKNGKVRVLRESVTCRGCSKERRVFGMAGVCFNCERTQGVQKGVTS